MAGGKMTRKMREVLADPYYKDPKQFTSTIYDENGKLIPEPDQEKMTEEEYFAQFIPADQARELVRKLMIAEAVDQACPLTEREPETMANPLSGKVSGKESKDWRVRANQHKTRQGPTYGNGKE